jgi:lactoylglutathione lyase/glyoxylase I family protein
MDSFTLPERNSQARLAALRASHVCLRVPDYDAEKTWFLDKLDFRVVHEWPEPMIGVRMCYLAAADDDGCIVEIVGDGDAPSPRLHADDLIKSIRQGGYHHFCFTVPDVVATVETLTKRGVTIVAEPFVVEAIGRRIAFFSDPFGNLFELEEVLG